jgi:hypothetical protein
MDEAPKFVRSSSQSSKALLGLWVGEFGAETPHMASDERPVSRATSVAAHVTHLNEALSVRQLSDTRGEINAAGK